MGGFIVLGIFQVAREHSSLGRYTFDLMLTLRSIVFSALRVYALWRDYPYRYMLFSAVLFLGCAPSMPTIVSHLFRLWL